MRFAELKKANERNAEMKALAENVLKLCNEPVKDWAYHIDCALADVDDALIAYRALHRYLSNG